MRLPRGEGGLEIRGGSLGDREKIGGGDGILLEDVIAGYGQTMGNTDLSTGCAEYSFNGLLFSGN